MQITIGLEEVAYFIVFCLVLAVGIFLIIALVNLIRLLKRVNTLVETNSENINQSLKVLPEVVNNVNDLSTSAKESVQSANMTIGMVKGAITETVTTVEDGTEGLFSLISIVSEMVKTIQGVMSMFSKK